MNRIFKLATAVSLAALFFVSCDDKSTPEEPALPTDGAYTGTVTVMAGTESEFVLPDIEVRFSINDSNTAADIEMLKVKFAERMPVTLDITIPGVTLTPASEGYAVSCGTDGIDPTYANGTPFPERKITDLTGSATTTTLSLAMKCGGDAMTFTGTFNAEK